MSQPRYKAAFLLPTGTKRNLGDDGWDFEFQNSLTDDIVPFLVENLALELSEKSKGFEIYRSEKIQMSVERSEESVIEYVYFQLFDLKATPLIALWSDSKFQSIGEVFVP
ncbi:MAG: hypothetical protein WBD51_07915 [Burkholderiaceae bacterium]